MNERIDLRDVTEPEVERDVTVARRRRGIMILRLTIMRLPAFRLQSDDEIAKARGAKFENAADAKRVVFRRAPSGDHAIAKWLRKLLEGLPISFDRPLNWHRL